MANVCKASYVASYQWICERITNFGSDLINANACKLKIVFDKYVGVAIANIIFNYWPRNKLAFVYSVVIRRTKYYTVETVCKFKRKIVLERETAIHIIHKCMAPHFPVVVHLKL